MTSKMVEVAALRQLPAFSGPLDWNRSVLQPVFTAPLYAARGVPPIVALVPAAKV